MWRLCPWLLSLSLITLAQTASPGDTAAVRQEAAVSQTDQNPGVGEILWEFNTGG